MDGACVRSPNYPSNYGNSQSCTITPTSLAVGQLLSATAFDTESNYDLLVVNGVAYSGTSGPSGVVLGSAFTWSSDVSFSYAGWEVCAHAALGPSTCPPSCPPSWIADNWCDSSCNMPECNYDGGDCSAPTPCPDACPPSWIADGMCDSSCNVPECNYDGGDCFGSPPAAPPPLQCTPGLSLIHI